LRRIDVVVVAAKKSFLLFLIPLHTSFIFSLFLFLASTEEAMGDAL